MKAWLQSDRLADRAFKLSLLLFVVILPFWVSSQTVSGGGGSGLHITDDGTNMTATEPVIVKGSGVAIAGGAADSSHPALRVGATIGGKPSWDVLTGDNASFTPINAQGYCLNSATCAWAPANGLFVVGSTTINDSSAVAVFDGNTVALTADWTCGTGGTVSSCTAATIIGSGGGVPLTFTLPLVARAWTWECDGVVGQATAATANSWNFLTATNGATNVTASYTMNTAATAMTGGATTDQASTTTTVVIGPTWTLGGTATKMPFHVWGRIEGASASGTVLSLQLVAPTVADLVTIYRGTSCKIR